MIINQASLNGIYKGFQTIFNKAFTEAKALYGKVATVIPSSAKSEEYKWLGKIPRMVEWVGDRVIQNLSAFSWTIKNKDWESTIEVDRNDIEDDAIGVYNPLVQTMAAAGKKHPDEIIWALLMAGFTSLCYDGQYFFDTDHVEGQSGAQSNKGTAKLSHDAYGTARTGMMSLKDDKGKASLGIFPVLLVVGPKNEKMGKDIVVARTLANGQDNVYAGTAELLVVPELAENPEFWFLMDVSKPVKPLIFQQRKKPVFTSLDKPDDVNVFMRKKYLYGVDSRDNAGYGLWQLAYGSDGTI